MTVSSSSTAPQRWQVIEEMVIRHLGDCIGCGAPDHFHLRICPELKRVKRELKSQHKDTNNG